MAEVRVEDIHKSFGRTEVLHGIAATFAEGSFTSLLGPSGCGKTTLLRIIAGLESVSSGAVAIDGRDVTNVPPERRDIAMMFQSYALLPHLTAAENVRFPLRMGRKGGRVEQDGAVREALELVHLEHLADRMPRQLSGGQQQRVALARAIVSKPKVLLLDEPLSNLDARLREEMQVELIELHKRLGLTTIFVTHDQDEALSLSDQVTLLHEGTIIQSGTPERIYNNPASAFAADFIGGANLLQARVEERDGGRVAVLPGVRETLPVDAGSPSGTATLVLRQEDITLCGGPDLATRGTLLPVTIETRVYLGARARYVASLGRQHVRCIAPPRPAFEPGQQAWLAVPEDALRLVRE